MTLLPLPAPLRDLLKLGQSGNRSLLFDKGIDRYTTAPNWKVEEKGKEQFLVEFVSTFKSNKDVNFTGFLRRRADVMKDLGAQPYPCTTQSRLVIGLGLPHPTETGFLFDRLTGCPYLPGSSVKGMLRAAARLVQQKELEGEKDFWDQHLDRLFGPELGPGVTARKGEATFFDAFPVTWPTLEVDVLTPHYGKYYSDPTTPPADWDNPVPVPFLTVAPNTGFCFYIAASTDDLKQFEALLETALDWLGIGAKKSAGYGLMSVPLQSDRPAQRPSPLPQVPWEARVRNVKHGNAEFEVTQILKDFSGEDRQRAAQAIVKSLGKFLRDEKRRDKEWVRLLREATGE